MKYQCRMITTEEFNKSVISKRNREVELSNKSELKDILLSSFGNFYSGFTGIIKNERNEDLFVEINSYIDNNRRYITVSFRNKNKEVAVKAQLKTTVPNKVVAKIAEYLEF